MTLDELPILILEHIIKYLGYEELISLSRTNKYFQEKVSNQVIETLRLPVQSINGFSRKQFKKSILRLEIISDLDADCVLPYKDFINRLESQLRAVNLTRVGDLTLLIDPGSTKEWHNTFGWAYFRKIMNQVIPRLFTGFTITPCFSCCRLVSDIHTGGWKSRWTSSVSPADHFWRMYRLAMILLTDWHI